MGRPTAGRSARQAFRAKRWEALRRNRREWILLGALIAAVAALMLLTDGITQLLMAGVLGSLITFGVVGWLIGDVRALSWQWGSIGEQQTADLLNELEDSWRAENDLPARRGNWDHVLTGPAGVFLIETKFLLSGNPVRVEGDEVVAGRARHPVGWLRGAAASLKQELERRTGRRHWVQAVVVIWGDFQARRLEGDRVMYLHANELLPWLREQPPTLDDESGLELQKAVAALRDEPIGPGRAPNLCDALQQPTALRPTLSGVASGERRRFELDPSLRGKLRRAQEVAAAEPDATMRSLEAVAVVREAFRDLDIEPVIVGGLAVSYWTRGVPESRS